MQLFFFYNSVYNVMTLLQPALSAFYIQNIVITRRTRVDSCTHAVRQCVRLQLITPPNVVHRVAPCRTFLSFSQQSLRIPQRRFRSTWLDTRESLLCDIRMGCLVRKEIQLRRKYCPLKMLKCASELNVASTRTYKPTSKSHAA